MNPLTNVKNIQRLNERELELGVSTERSWHQQYKDSAWIFIGGLPYDLTEGDVICVFSQYGEIVNVNLIRDKKTGKSKGFAFLCYEDQRSTILAVDNLNGIKLTGRTIRVDHVEEYKVPKMREDMDPESIKMAMEGCAPQAVLVTPPSMASPMATEIKIEKKVKVKKEKHKKKRKDSSSSESPEEEKKKKSKRKTEREQKSSSEETLRVKKEKIDSGYEKNDLRHRECRETENRGQKRRCSEEGRRDNGDVRGSNSGRRVSSGSGWREGRHEGDRRRDEYRDQNGRGFSNRR